MPYASVLGRENWNMWGRVYESESILNGKMHQSPLQSVDSKESYCCKSVEVDTEKHGVGGVLYVGLVLA